MYTKEEITNIGFFLSTVFEIEKTTVVHEPFLDGEEETRFSFHTIRFRFSMRILLNINFSIIYLDCTNKLTGIFLEGKQTAFVLQVMSAPINRHISHDSW